MASLMAISRCRSAACAVSILARFVQAASRTIAAKANTPSAKAFAGPPMRSPINPGLASLNSKPSFSAGYWRASSAATTFRSASACAKETLGLSRPTTQVFHVFRLSSHGLPASICGSIIIGTQTWGQ